MHYFAIYASIQHIGLRIPSVQGFLCCGFGMESKSLMWKPYMYHHSLGMIENFWIICIKGFTILLYKLYNI